MTETDAISACPRVIAAGVHEGRLQLTLALMPTTDATASFPFSEWPEQIEALLQRREWGILVAGHRQGASWHTPDAPNARRVPAAAWHIRSLAAATRDPMQPAERLVTGLWNWVMGEGAGVPQGLWEALRNVIDETAPAISNNAALDVAGTGRSEAALLFSAARAAATLDRLAGRWPPDVQPAAPPERSSAPTQMGAVEAASPAAAAAAAKDSRDQYWQRDVAPTLLAAKLDQAAQADGRTDYLNASDSGNDAAAALGNDRMRGPAGSAPREVIAEALSGSDIGPIATRLRALHRAATTPDYVDDNAQPGQPGCRSRRADGTPKRAMLQADSALPSHEVRARQLLFALRANPTLGRLFRFTIDIDIDAGALLTPASEDASQSKNPQFVFLACDIGQVSPVWTLTKLSSRTNPVTGQRQLTQAWPALREELDLAAAPANAARWHRSITQTGGLVRLGQGLTGGLAAHARFDLVTADAAFASERDLRRVDQRQERFASAAKIGPQIKPAPITVLPDALITRGIALVDRWRQSTVVAEIVNAAHFRAHPARVLDAEDLAIGFRLYAGVHGARGVRWRDLMRRRIAYTDPRPSGSSIPIETMLSVLGLGIGSLGRLASDAATITVPSRSREMASGFMVHVEENLATWEGDPLALSCTMNSIPIQEGSDLAIGRSYSLEEAGPGRMWPLRLGWAYRIGGGVVWLGGVSVPIADAEASFAQDDTLALPSMPSEPGMLPLRRFLRHEAIHPPELLLPQAFARRPDAYVRQTGPIAILRPPQPAADQDASTWRVLVPPNLSLDDVWRHGVLDTAASHGNAPPQGGLPTIDYDRPWGGFPVFGRPANNEAFELGLIELQAPMEEGRPVLDEFKRPKPPEVQGENVFRARSTDKRRFEYYPDPAAEQMVIALRPARATGPHAYFLGLPVVVDLRTVNADFRAALPVVVEFVRKPGARAQEPSQEDFLAGGKPSLRYADGQSGRLTAKPAPGAAAVQAVTFHLYEGEHVAADCWCVPRADILARWFDLPETIAAIAEAEGGGADGAVAWLDGKYPMLDGSFAIFADHAAGGWVAAAGLPVHGATVRTVARTLRHCLGRMPMPSLSGIRTIEAVHATAYPVRAPAFVPLVNGELFGLTRYKTEAAEARLELLGAWREQDPTAWRNGIPPGATGLLLAGTVLFDRTTCSSLEVIAECTSPLGPQMDDPTRRRTDEQKLTGEWPQATAGQPSGNRANALVGFAVASDGRVTLQRSQVTLLRIDNLREWVEPASNAARPAFAGLEPLRLDKEQRDAMGADGADVPRVTLADPFHDSLARELFLSLRATSRHQHLTERIVLNPATLLPEDLPAIEPTPGMGMPQSLWLPATLRPSEPAIDVVLPAFTWPKQPVRPAGAVVAVRAVRLRIWLDRPWFSSGEGERLGLVIWPPALDRADSSKLERGTVPRFPGIPADRSAGSQPDMDMVAFTDADLGPGGKFVTRWGADPIRDATDRHVGPFMPWQAFQDGSIAIEADPSDDRPQWVRSVAMPVFPLGKDDKTDLVNTLRVGLVTYVPRFDLDREKWFVDVAINTQAPGDLVEPFIRLGLVRYQAHAIAGLQVSSPVSAWSQILPRREVRVWRDGLLLHIQVSGPMAPRVDDKGAAVYPLMRACLLKSSITSAKQRTEAPIMLPGCDGAGWITMDNTAPAPETSVLGNAWRLDYVLADDEVPTATRSLWVAIEETEDFLSTADEPVAPEMSKTQGLGETAPTLEGHHQTSGPRFIARVEVPRLLEKS